MTNDIKICNKKIKNKQFNEVIGADKLPTKYIKQLFINVKNDRIVFALKYDNYIRT